MSVILYEINKEYIEELSGLEVAAISGALSLLYVILKKAQHTELLQQINQCYDNNYLEIQIYGENIKDVDTISKLVMIRKRELSRLLTTKGLVLVFNKDAYKILRAAFSDIEFFNILSSGKTAEYDIDTFIQKFNKYFKTFGEYRKNVNIEKILTLFPRIDVESLSDCARLNLIWIGMLLRQLVLYGKDLGITKVRFVSKQVQSVELES